MRVLELGTSRPAGPAGSEWTASLLVASRASEVDGVAVLDLDVEVECSTGTYVRALARDLGAALGVGGHLTALAAYPRRAVQDR